MSRLLAISKLFCFSWATRLRERHRVRMRVVVILFILLVVLPRSCAALASG
jgi:hypothetical protein